jgi:hypothetical protein
LPKFALSFFTMHFINPWFLFGFLAIGIPIAIHLFNFRRYKKVFFTNVRFIKEVKQETRKQSQLRHLIVLLLRILAITALVFAFAQPFIPLSDRAVNPKAVNYISIYVDNSFSMQAEGNGGTLLDEAKTKATGIASAYKTSDYYQLVTNDFEAKHRLFVNRDELGGFLGEVETGPVTRSLPDVVARQKESFGQAGTGSRLVYLLSDFQKNTTHLDQLRTDTTTDYFLVPLVANTLTNLYIDSCWFESPVHLVGQKVKLMVRVKNSSVTPVEKVPLTLTLNKSKKAVSSFNVGPNASVDITISYMDNEAGIHNGLLEIIDNPLIYDDKFYFSYDIQAAIPLLCINGGQPSPYLNSLLGSDSAFRFQNVAENSIDYAAFASNNLIILNEVKQISSGLAQELQKFVGGGGNLMVIPASDMDVPNYAAFLSSLGSNTYGPLNKVTQKISFMNLQSNIYNDVFESLPENIDLPQVFSYYTINRSSRSDQEMLLKMQNGDAFLTSQLCGVGKVYLMAVPLQTQFSNLPKHALFVPTFYKISLLSHAQQKLYYIIGKDEVIDIPSGEDAVSDNVFKVKKTDTDVEIIPGQRKTVGRTSLLMHDQIRSDGNYSILQGKTEVTGVSFNNDRAESNLGCYTPAEIKSIIEKQNLKNVRLIDSKAKPISQTVTELNQGIKLWKTFILLALLFLAAEVILLRFWK